jgi:LPPG:FO 2-phospho-L-lactate transferase
MITALCGGVGGSKLAWGLYTVLPADSLTIVVNTADDLDFYGLHVSPDLDTVTYTLAGLSRPDVGWGLAGDTFRALEMLSRYGQETTWFGVGDADLATHVYRTNALRAGETLTAVTRHLRECLGVRAEILPMTDDPVATRLLVDSEWLDFQEYFVHRRHQVPVDKYRYDGIEQASATETVVQALLRAEAIILVNSNPVLSINPILAVPSVRHEVQCSRAPRVAVSPIIGEAAVSGPAGELMRLIDLPASATGVARAYHGLIDGIVIDRRDAAQRDEIEADLGIAVCCTETIMRTDDDKMRLAGKVIAFSQGLRS